MHNPAIRIMLANGTWTDVELKLSCRTALLNSRSDLTAEEAGKVIISGESNLGNLGLVHIVVSGLVFTDGYTPTS